MVALMSEPVDFEGSNIVYTAPKDTNCYDLPAFTHPEGVAFCVRFTPEELVDIAKSGCVWVNMMTHSIAPILLSATSLVTMPDGHLSKPEPFMNRARIGGLVNGEA